MKKYSLGMLAVLTAIIVSSFTADEKKLVVKEQINNSGYAWFHFNGTSILDMLDPSMYSLDEDNYPDCTSTFGILFCEVYAPISLDNPLEPVLSMILMSNMKPL